MGRLFHLTSQGGPATGGVEPLLIIGERGEHAGPPADRAMGVLTPHVIAAWERAGSPVKVPGTGSPYWKAATRPATEEEREALRRLASVS